MAKLIDSFKGCLGLKSGTISPEFPEIEQVELKQLPWKITSDKSSTKQLAAASINPVTPTALKARPPGQPKKAGEKSRGNKLRKSRAKLEFGNESKISIGDRSSYEVESEGVEVVLGHTVEINLNPLHKVVTHRDLPLEVSINKAVQTVVSGPIRRAGPKVNSITTNKNPSVIPTKIEDGDNNTKKDGGRVIPAELACPKLPEGVSDQGPATDGTKSGYDGNSSTKNGESISPRSKRMNDKRMKHLKKLQLHQEQAGSQLNQPKVDDADLLSRKSVDDVTQKGGLSRSDENLIESMLKEMNNGQNTNPNRLSDNKGEGAGCGPTENTGKDGLTKSDVELIENLLKHIDDVTQKSTYPSKRIGTNKTPKRNNALPPIKPIKQKQNAVTDAVMEGDRSFYVASCDSLSWIPDSSSGPPTPRHKAGKPYHYEIRIPTPGSWDDSSSIFGSSPIPHPPAAPKPCYAPREGGSTLIQPSTPTMVRPKAAIQRNHLPRAAVPSLETAHPTRVRPRAAVARNRQVALRHQMEIAELRALDFQGLLPATNSDSREVLRSPPIKNIADKYQWRP